MANSIIILGEKTLDQKSVKVTDQTDWSVVTGSRDSLTGITLYIYEYTDTTTEIASYQLTSSEEASYQASGVVTIPFISFTGNTYLDDAYYYVKMVATSDTYISNLSGFGITIDTTNLVYSNINSLHTPEKNKFDAEQLILQSIYLAGMNYLETSNVNQRDVKFTKRLNYIQKTNS